MRQQRNFTKTHSYYKVSREEQTLRTRRLHRSLAFGCSLLGLFGVITCGYGHAAVSQNLYIEGTATVARTGINFQSTYMQDVTPAECEAVENDATKQMIDKRDGKSYWVQKMRDGSCWMTQDLKFDILPGADGKIELTSELTDINNPEEDESWYPSRIGANGQKIWLWNEDAWLPPTETFFDNTSFRQLTNTTYSSNRGDRIINIPGDIDRGLIWVTDEDKEGNPMEVYKPAKGRLPNGVSHDDTTMTYDTHYLIGNYYQYNTAAAGGRQGNWHSVSSICPRGWTLPLTPDTGKLYDGIMEAYADDMTNFSQYAFPLYFSQAGYQLDGGLQDLGGMSYYWQSWFTTTSKRTALATISQVEPRYQRPREAAEYIYYGFTVRCKLRQGEEI